MEDKKEKLIAAATVLFADHGYQGVSIRQIGEAAGVNSAMISYYFGGKQGLYDAVLGTQMAPVKAFAEEDMSHMDPRDVIRRYAAQMLRVHQEKPHLLAYIFREFTTPSDTNNSIFCDIAPKLFQLLAGALTRGVDGKIFRADLDVPSATLLLAGIVNFHYLSRNPRDKLGVTSIGGMSEERYLRQAVDVFLKGIERRDPQ